MQNWDEIRTAYHVARMGTVSGAAEVLGVHHATVIRHIDALEERLGAKLFQRHARGYTPTEAGSDLLLVAQATSDQFSQLEGRIRGQGETVAGDLIVTSLEAMTPLIAPVLVAFQAKYPDIRIQYLTGERLFRLEYGEAHVAIRAGNAPDQPDNVVQPLLSQCIALYASDAYVAKNGLPTSEKDLAGHKFVAGDARVKRAPFYRWLDEHVSEKDVIYRASDFRAIETAVASGVGMGFMTELSAAQHGNLVQALPPREEWRTQLWLVTHVDLHRTLKVQTFLKFLKEEAKGWLQGCKP